MKTLKKLTIGLLVSASSLSAFGQQWGTTNLTTGIDTLTGNRIYWPSNDQRWMVKKPNTGYQNVQIGTGYNSTYNYSFSDITPNAGWLTPHPVTQALINSNPILYAGASPGDMRAHQSANNGDYIYRMKFNLTYPACQKPTKLNLVVDRLTANEIVDDIYINGHYVGKLSSMTTSLGTGATSLWQIPYQGSNLYAHNSSQAMSMLGNAPTYYPSPWMPNYTIANLPAQFLVNGANYIYFTAPKNSVNSSSPFSSGFLCDAHLDYFYDQEYPALDVSQSTRYTCNGLAFVKFKVSNPTSSSTTYTARIYLLPNLVNPIYTNTSVAANALVSVPVSIPVTFDNYKVVITKNGAGCGISTASKTLSIYKCEARSFSISSNNHSNRFSITATPDNPEETTIPGFETLWKLEELDPITFEPIYTIDNPACWNTEDGSTSFTSFKPENSYSGLVEPFTCDPSFTAGYFFADHIYRITRTTHIDGSDWQEYSVILNDDDGIMMNDPFRLQMINDDAANQTTQLTVSPNPSLGVFNLSFNNNNAKNIRVYDMLGNLIIEEFNVTDKMISMDLTQQPKGVYLIQVNDGISNETIRLIRD